VSLPGPRGTATQLVQVGRSQIKDRPVSHTFIWLDSQVNPETFYLQMSGVPEVAQ
jgi:hypothetical protein